MMEMVTYLGIKIQEILIIKENIRFQEIIV